MRQSIRLHCCGLWCSLRRRTASTPAIVDPRPVVLAVGPKHSAKMSCDRRIKAALSRLATRLDATTATAAVSTACAPPKYRKCSRTILPISCANIWGSAAVDAASVAGCVDGGTAEENEYGENGEYNDGDTAAGGTLNTGNGPSNGGVVANGAGSDTLVPR